MTNRDHDLDDFEDVYPDDLEPMTSPDAEEDPDLVYSDVATPRVTPGLILAVVLVVTTVLVAVGAGITA